jgi:asparagine synthase (glutamine-hydrolysing)
LEFRNPYFDIHLLRYMLAVPALPWCRVKYLIRRAMRRSLPKAVLRRPKAPLDPNPWLEFSRRSPFQPMVPAEGLEHYVDVARVPGGTVTTNSTYEEALRPRRLNYWLKNINPVR